MLGRALKGHHPAPGIQNNKGTLPTLKPIPSSDLNSRSSWPSSSNSLKRTSSEISGGGSWGSQERVGKRQFSGQQIGTSQDLSRLEKLHTNVFFDENDFDDDSKLDLDDEPPAITNASTVKPASTLLPTPLPTKTGHQPTRTPASSAPLQWSSSPASHYTMPPPKAAPAVQPARKTKRNGLPWGRDDDKRSHDELLDESGPRPPHPHKTLTDVNTPRNHKMADMPWNTTASAVKEAQKKMRHGQRRIKEESGDKEKTKLAKEVARRNNLAKVFLSDEQKQVLDLVAEKKQSVFFTGSAGTGKSVLLRETIKVLRDKYRREPDRVAVTASTGLAACNVGGVTLHSFAGIGLGKEAVPELVKKIKRNTKAKQRWLRTKVLIIDEISMVDGDLFDKLESISRAIRNNGRPFGGIQLVITGDFFQLPPVPDYGREAKFAFDAASWTTSIGHTIGLTQIFRQKDPVFANMLNEMRLGRLTPKSIHAFRSLSRPLSFADEFVATELFPTRNEVDYANNARMSRLSEREFEFKALDGGAIQDINQRDKLLQNCMAPTSIKLKRGAQVMLIKNIDETLVNGSVGKVMGFMDEKTFEYYHHDETEFDTVVKMGDDDENMTGSRKVLKQHLNNNSSSSTAQKWPLVKFQIPDGTSRELLCQNEVWKIELPSGEVQAFRQQIPLILAWALSIHKAQGQTLDRVKVDLGKIFEKGQAYVALSRATCQEGLQILRFEPGKVMAHDKVRKFYDGLYTANQALERKLVQEEETKGKILGRGFADEFGFEEDEVALANRYY